MVSKQTVTFRNTFTAMVQAMLSVKLSAAVNHFYKFTYVTENTTAATKSVMNWGGLVSHLLLRPTGVGGLKQWQHYQSLQVVSPSN